MDDNVNTFILCSSQRKLLTRMNAEQKAELLDALFAFNDGEEVHIQDPLADMAFMVISESIVRMRDYREQKRLSGQKGGSANKRNEAQPKQSEAQPKQGEARAKQSEAPLKQTEAEPKQTEAINVNVNGNELINNNNINSARTRTSERRIPSVEDVQAYCDERQNGISAEAFCDYYAAQGWRLANGQALKDWKAAVRQWERHDKERRQAQLPALQGTPHFCNYGQQVKWEQDQQAAALLATGDRYRDDPNDIPPEWR